MTFVRAVTLALCVALAWSLLSGLALAESGYTLKSDGLWYKGGQAFRRISSWCYNSRGCRYRCWKYVQVVKAKTLRDRLGDLAIETIRTREENTQILELVKALGLDPQATAQGLGLSYGQAQAPQAVPFGNTTYGLGASVSGEALDINATRQALARAQERNDKRSERITRAFSEAITNEQERQRQAEIISSYERSLQVLMLQRLGEAGTSPGAVALARGVPPLAVQHCGKCHVGEGDKGEGIAAFRADPWSQEKALRAARFITHPDERRNMAIRADLKDVASLLQEVLHFGAAAEAAKPAGE